MPDETKGKKMKKKSSIEKHTLAASNFKICTAIPICTIPRTRAHTSFLSHLVLLKNQWETLNTYRTSFSISSEYNFLVKLSERMFFSSLLFSIIENLSIFLLRALFRLRGDSILKLLLLKVQQSGKRALSVRTSQFA